MKTIKRVFIAIIILCSVWWAVVAFLQRPKSITKEVTANVYTNGVGVSETTIFIDGTVKEMLFSEEATYGGLFQIACYERSSRNRTTARVDWIEGDYQLIRFYQPGNSTTLDITDIVIDKQMEDIGIVFKDGTIVATSENSYLECMKRLSYRQPLTF